jgi:hypothetical protein
MGIITGKAMRIILIAIMMIGFGGGRCDGFSPDDGKPLCHKKSALTADAGPPDAAPCRMAPCTPGNMRGIAPFLFTTSSGRCNALPPLLHR